MEKKITAIFLIAGLIFTTAFAEELNSKFAERIAEIKFNDIEEYPVDHWSIPAVYTMSALGVIKGDSGMFRPQGNTTRSEALAVLMRSAGLEQTAEYAHENAKSLKEKYPYRYNKIDEWADGYIRLAVDYQILSVDQYNKVMSIEYQYGTEPKEFIKEGAVTRAEVAEWFVKIFKLPLAEKPNMITDFSDCSDLPEETVLYLETALNNGIIKGDGNGLRPDGTITRQELAQILFNARNLICEKKEITVESATVSDVMTDTVSATEREMVNRTELLLDNDKSFTCTRTYTLSGAGVDYDVYNKNDTDILTIKEGQPVGGVHLLNTGDDVEVFSDKNGVPFMIVSKKAQSTVTELLSDDYLEGTPVIGTLYLINENEKMLVVKTENGDYEEVAYLDGLEAYWRQDKIETKDFMAKCLDLPCVVFRAKAQNGTIYRAYRIQFLAPIE